MAMGTYVTGSAAGFSNGSLWVGNAGQSSSETFAGLQSSSGSLLSGTANQTFEEYTFQAGGLTYRYIGEWNIDFSGSLLSGSVSADGYYDRVEIYDGADLVSSYSGDAIPVDFGSSATGLLSAVTGLLGVVTGLLLQNDDSAIDNLHLDATPNLLGIAFRDPDDIEGGAGVDFLNGAASNDVVEGGGSGDTLEGGSGVDTLSYETSNARVLVNLSTESVSGGHADNDTISGFENVTGSAFRDGIVGDDGVNMVWGGGGSDTIQGLGGADRLYGGTGNDYIQGGDDNDRLFGEDGDDRLYSGRGKDLLSGGGGDDVFEFRSPTDSSAAGGHRDLIVDFVAGDDKIDLSRIDADLSSSGDQGFSLIGTSAFSGTEGELRYVTNGVSSTLFGDVNGDGIADFGIDVANVTNFSSADFIA